MTTQNRRVEETNIDCIVCYDDAEFIDPGYGVYLPAGTMSSGRVSQLLKDEFDVYSWF